MKKIAGIIFIAIIFSGCASLFTSKYEPRTPLGKLQFNIAQKFEDSNFVNAHWGVLIKSLKTGETIYARNEKKMFMPASNMKLFATASALAILGNDFRYTTKLVSTGEVKNGVLNGDVIYVGSGDPTNTLIFNDSIPEKVFSLWVDSLKAKGISQINGRIIGDDNCFDEEYYGYGWEADDETYYYGAQIGGICYNDNCVDFTVTADVVAGNKCAVTFSPNTKYITVVNQTVTAPQSDSVSAIEFTRKRGTNIIYVKGKISVGKKPYRESIAVDNPTLFALTVFKEVLESKGIKVNGAVVDIDDLDSLKDYSLAQQLASYISPTMAEIAKATNKPSQNLYAEQIFRTIGAQKLNKGSMDNSKAIVYPLLASWGVDTVRLRARDASGLSRHDLITPSDIVSILTGMYNSPNRDVFYDSQPIAGVDGTIKNRMKGTKAEGNAHAKTGSIAYVRSLSGYVTSADGEMFVFSMMANHYTVPTRLAEKIQDAVCVMLAEFSR